MCRIGLLMLCMLLCMSALSCAEEAPEAGIRVYFLDVGQGDSILLRTAQGDVLIDAGTEHSQELLCVRLEELGVTSLSLAIFTHPDEDHIGGADGVLAHIPTEEIWFNDEDESNDSLSALQRVIQEKEILHHTVMAGTVRKFGEATISVLSPASETATKDSNHGSIVIKLSYKEADALFMADADADTEEELLARYGRGQLSCDLYKVGHHGSYTSSGEAFLQVVKPTYAVISSGRGNRFGHPHGEVLDRLTASGAMVLRTDLLGEIVFETDGTTWKRS